MDCFDLTFRNGGVHHGQTSEVLLHGDEHSSAGGTSSHRDDNQHRPGGVAAQGKIERKTDRQGEHPVMEMICCIGSSG